jgi:hypothetical protein
MRTLALVMAPILLCGCAATFVAPYDEKLVSGTDALYKKGAAMIAKGEMASPKSSDERRRISNPAKHPGHVSAFEADYQALLVDTDALVLRAMSGRAAIDRRGEKLQAEIAKLVEASGPSQCPEFEASFPELSLTAANYVDLKCLFLRWQAQHGDEAVTQGTGILKRVNWEGRKRTLFNAALAIQQAERFKKPKTE